MRINCKLTLLFSSFVLPITMQAQLHSAHRRPHSTPDIKQFASRGVASSNFQELNPQTQIISTPAQQLYTVVPIAPPVGRDGTSVSSPRAINNTGAIAATGENYYDGSYLDFYSSLVPFIWKNGVYTLLPNLPGTTGSFASAINDSGQVIGDAYYVIGQYSSTSTAVLWDRGSVISIGASFPTSLYTYADGLNNRGQVVGGAYLNNDNIETPYLWQNGRASILPLPSGVTSAEADWINDAGQIVGYWYDRNDVSHTLLWTMIGQQMVVEDLGTPGGDYSYGSFINNHGQVVGEGGDALDNDIAFTWNGGPLTTLGRLFGATYSYATAMNDHGLIVGGGDRQGLKGSVPLLWQKTGVIDLNTVVPAGTPLLINGAVGINEVGEIVTYQQTLNGATGIALLKPLYLP